MKYVAALLVVAFLGPAEARDPRAVRAFRHDHPCPANLHSKGKCPGYIVDHVIPLCAGGADNPGNMQWQTKGEAIKKDREEWRQCRELRRAAKK